jgi:hypothetical protein
MDDALKERFVVMFTPEVERLSDVLNRDLTHGCR